MAASVNRTAKSSSPYRPTKPLPTLRASAYPSSSLTSPLDHHHLEHAGHDRRPPPRIRRCGPRGPGSEVARDDVQAMFHGIEPHVARAGRRLDVLDNVVLIRAVFVDPRQGAARI